jgi:hypothetical protein
MENGALTCDVNDKVKGLTELTYTADCGVDGFAVVDIYVHDEANSESDNAVPHSACGFSSGIPNGDHL